MRRLNPTLIYWLQTWGYNENMRTGLEYPEITQEGKLLCSPGRSTKRGAGPRYETDLISQAVNAAIDQICSLDHALIECRYRDGMSDRIIGLICSIKEGAARWQVEKAHRQIAVKLNISVYR